jgi:tetratricopeptide (TPR) repeat protein
MGDGMAHAARAIDMDPGDARGFEMRGVFGYFLWASAPTDSAGSAAAWLALARSDLELATQLSRDASRAWNYLSVILFQDGNYAGAYLAATNALRADQFMANAFSNRVRLFWSALELGDFAAADRWCRAIDEDTPASAEGEYCALVLAAWAPDFKTMTPAAAAALVDSALRAPDAELSRLRAAQAVILANQGDATGARELLGRIPRTSADDPIVVDIAWVYTALGEHARAKRILDEFINREPASRAGITRSARFTSYRASGAQPTTRTVAVHH